MYGVKDKIRLNGEYCVYFLSSSSKGCPREGAHSNFSTRYLQQIFFR